MLASAWVTTHSFRVRSRYERPIVEQSKTLFVRSGESQCQPFSRADGVLLCPRMANRFQPATAATMAVTRKDEAIRLMGKTTGGGTLELRGRRGSLCADGIEPDRNATRPRIWVAREEAGSSPFNSSVNERLPAPLFGQTRSRCQKGNLPRQSRSVKRFLVGFHCT